MVIPSPVGLDFFFHWLLIHAFVQKTLLKAQRSQGPPSTALLPEHPARSYLSAFASRSPNTHRNSMPCGPPVLGSCTPALSYALVSFLLPGLL